MQRALPGHSGPEQLDDIERHGEPCHESHAEGDGPRDPGVQRRAAAPALAKGAMGRVPRPPLTTGTWQ